MERHKNKFVVGAMTLVIIGVSIISIAGQKPYSSYVQQKEDANRWYAIVEMMPAGVIFVEPDGTISYANTGAEKIAGKSLVGTTLLDLIADKDTRRDHEKYLTKYPDIRDRFQQSVEMRKAKINTSTGSIETTVQVRGTEVDGAYHWLVFFDNPSEPIVTKNAQVNPLTRSTPEG